MAVDAVLKGEDITNSNFDAQISMPPPPTTTTTPGYSCAYDIRHVHTNKSIGSMNQKQNEFHGFADNEKIELDLTLGLDPIAHAGSCTGNSFSAGTTSSSENYRNFPPLAETSDGWTTI